MKKRYEIGDAVTASPVGEGKITGFNKDGYPEVNGVFVQWFVSKKPDGTEMVFGEIM